MTSGALECWLTSEASNSESLRKETEDQKRLSTRLAWICGVSGVLLFAAAALPFQSAVIGHGRTETSLGTQVVSHPTGGIVDALFVADGDRVRPGQPIARLKPNLADAAARTANTIAERTAARRARLEAEARGAASMDVSGMATEAGESIAFAEEASLFATRRSAYLEGRRQVQAQTMQLAAEIDGLNAQAAALAQQSDLLEDEKRGIEDLWERRLVTLSRVNAVRRLSVELAGRVKVNDAQIREARSRQAGLSRRLAELDDTRKAEAGAELARLGLETPSQDYQKAEVDQQGNETTLRAPVAGVVNALSVKGPGQVIKPAEPVVEVVPLGGELIVEALFSPSDIDQLRVGLPVLIRFPGLARLNRNDLTGKIFFVSATELSDTKGDRKAFLARIKIERKSLIEAKQFLTVGMPAEVFVQTGSQTVLSYFFSPLKDQFRRAFREN